jgi:hypothetical protein
MVNRSTAEPSKTRSLKNEGCGTRRRSANIVIQYLYIYSNILNKVNVIQNHRAKSRSPARGGQAYTTREMRKGVRDDALRDDIPSTKRT